MHGAGSGRWETMSIEPYELRRIMGHFVSGVVVVASRRPESGRPCGLTANSVASVSLDPALVLVCVDREADSHDCIQESGYFSLNILAAHQEKVSRRFASWDLEEKFTGIGYHIGESGAPILDESLGWLDCRLWASYPGGDHTIFVGEVLAGDAEYGAPLLYYRGGYGRFEP
jgi:flavin reductase (DIM6/NTAB) family NADH-FMN oxidoreductase RutF